VKQAWRRSPAVLHALACDQAEPYNTRAMDLNAHRFFNHFPAVLGARLARIAEVKRWPDRGLIFEENAPSTAIHLVLSGHINLTKRVPGGFTQIIARKGPDDYFGELGVLDGSGRSTSATADGPVTLARLEKKAFLKILSLAPWHSVLRLFNHVSENLRATNDRYVTEVVRKEKITLIGEMANAMIHDFKNPFTTIRLAMDMLAGRHSDEATQQVCRTVHRQIHRLGGMVEEVLEFAKGDTRLNIQPVKISALFDALAEHSQDALAQTKTTVVVRPTPLVAPLDFDRFLRVLQNLVTNAAEAIGAEKRGRITLAAARKGRHCELTIADNGPGIPRAIRGTLFEPFVTHGKRGGTGLGLAIAKSLTEAHKGDISYRSTPGRGTTFVIRLPLAM